MENIKITDSDEHLDMMSFLDCTNDSPYELKTQRGIVLDKEKNVLVGSFGFTDLYTKDDQEKITTLLEPLEDWSFYYSMEATLLRVFFHNEKWYLVTHKKLDAFKSRWSCRETFGELFTNHLAKLYNQRPESVLEWFYTLLDKNKVYCFLLKSNSENRIVCQYNYKQDKIVFLGSFGKGSEVVLDMVNNTIHELDSMDRPASVEIGSMEDLFQKVEAINFFEHQGVLAMNKKNFHQIKIFNSSYYKYYQLRGNNPNIRFRYLELRNEPEKLKSLYFLYPKSAETFDQYEDTLVKIARMIYHFYVSRYIKNQFITLPKEEFLIMKKCHDWYLTDRKNNRIFSKKVMEFMLEETPLHLYKMIRRYNMNQNMAFHQNMNMNYQGVPRPSMDYPIHTPR